MSWWRVRSSMFGKARLLCQSTHRARSCQQRQRLRAPSFSTATRTTQTVAPQEVTVVEVGPRDGLQNETSSSLTVDQRVQFINLLVQAGCPRIEVGSFVSPQWVPAMAHSDQVYEKVVQQQQRQEPSSSSSSATSTTFSCLVPNVRGMKEALRVNVHEIAIFAAASETFSQKNINSSIDESMERYQQIIQMAKDASIPVRGYLSCIVACPYEGYVDPVVVAQRTAQLLDMGCYEVSLGETIGVATAATTRQVLQAVTAAVPASQLAVHFHDTYGQAVANTLVALEEFDVTVVDAAVAGLGGCPYAPGAAGNLATEDLVYLLQGLGVETGINMDGLVQAADYVTGILGKSSRSKAGVAHAAMEKTSATCV